MNILNLVKQHRYETVCVVLALLILLALWPASRMGLQARSKTEEVENWQDRASKVQRAGPDGLATEALVAARKEYLQQMDEETKKVAELFRQKNKRPFLVEDDMFPKAVAAAPLRFRTRYNDAIDNLLSQTLQAGWPADQEPATAEGKTSHTIYVYARRDNLSIGTWASDAGVPSEEDCWFAQLGLWIQQDLAEVFSTLNDASAQQQGQKSSVENAAVKRIISIDIDPYYYVGLEKQAGQSPATPFSTPSSPLTPGQLPPPGMFPMGMGMGMPGLPLAPTQKASKYSRTAQDRAGAQALKDQNKPFTERTCDDKADVLHFSFSVVVDSRCINELLAALSRKNLYTILCVSLSREDVKIDALNFPKSDRSYETFDPYDDAEKGLLYGSDPIVRLDVDAEILFLKDICAQYMPNDVKQLLNADSDQARQQRLAKQQAHDMTQKAAQRQAAQGARAKSAGTSKTKPKN